MTEVVSGVVMFTVVVLALVALLLGARAAARAVGRSHDHDQRGSRQGAEGGRRRHAARARSSNQKIFIPSACGGKGACGVCEVIVKSGGGALLPTETGYINRGDARRGCRLACQVKVKRDMAIEIAPGGLRRAQVDRARSSPTATSPPSSRS